MNKKIRVLVVDDSALVRQVLAEGLGRDPGIEVVGAARDPFHARDLIVSEKPDVVTLDVEMPRMDGVEFLRRLMPQFPLPVIMVSSLTRKGAKITMAAMEAGALDFVLKPKSNLQGGLSEMMRELLIKIKIGSTANVSHWKRDNQQEVAAPISHALAESTDKVIAIGASTGGTVAIQQIICALPLTSPGILVTQHMPPSFTAAFANQLDARSQLRVRVASDGDRLMPGNVLIAPGDQHLRVKRMGGIYLAECSSGQQVCGHIPSVEVLFESMAGEVGANGVGVILTGIGRDGASGLLKMLEAGAFTIGQDERSSAVYGMPRAAAELGAVKRQVGLGKIPITIYNALKRMEEAAQA